MENAVPIVILGSSRRNGNTPDAGLTAFGGKADMIDLQDYTISPYDYDNTNRDDDFLKIIDLITLRKTLVFATPVYWYAMSARLKIFFDRLTDLITIEKPKGRTLAGKSVWLIAAGTDQNFPGGFETPFTRTCKYFDLDYKGANYHYTGDDQTLRQSSAVRLREFGRKILHDHQRFP